MKYEIVTPTSTDFNIDREFDIVKTGFAELGVEVTQKVGGDTVATYAIETGSDCDIKASTGYTGFDIAMWDWIPYIDPDPMLSYLTKAQWCVWNDTGWDNPEYDKMYQEQGITIDPEKRKQIVYEMQQIVYDEFVYTQLINQDYFDAHVKTWIIPTNDHEPERLLEALLHGPGPGRIGIGGQRRNRTEKLGTCEAPTTF